jgi:hypothetical protein
MVGRHPLGRVKGDGAEQRIALVVEHRSDYERHVERTVGDPARDSGTPA